MKTIRRYNTHEFWNGSLAKSRSRFDFESYSRAWSNSFKRSSWINSRFSLWPTVELFPYDDDFLSDLIQFALPLDLEIQLKLTLKSEIEDEKNGN